MVCPSRFDKNRRILVIDDSQAIHEDFRKVLEANESGTAELKRAEATLLGTTPQVANAEGFCIESAFQGQESVSLVRQAKKAKQPFALAFVDMRMPPGWDGLETIAHIWQADPDIQVVICTAYSDYSWEEIVSKLGRTDQLLILKKPFETAEVRQLATSLTEKWDLTRQARLKLGELDRMVAERTDELREMNQALRDEIVGRKKAEQELRHSALHDSLTNLPNRPQLRSCLERCIERTRRQPGYSFAVLFLDLDNFKVVNDSLGHDIGDELLVGTADRLVKSLRSLDAVARIGEATTARLGGDEFVIILDGLDRAHDAMLVAERLQNELSVPFEFGGREVVVSVSIGIALSDEGCQSAGEMLRNADTAMYRAKQGGKARHAFFDRDMHGQVMARLELENDLRSALERGEFRLVYQPIIDLESAQISGIEALVRWQRPGHGTISPGAFIPIAEELGLIVPVGRWVLQEACHQLSTWNHQLPPGREMSVGVNVSRAQLTEVGFCADVEQALRVNNIAGPQLHLEITESVVIETPDVVDRRLRKLKELGVQLHLDHFGAGYSSLSCLHSFPLDALKIDRVFVGSPDVRREYAAVISAVMTLARSLNMKVIAEGIETKARLAQIVAFDCDYAQGHYFSKPLDAAAAWTLLTSEPAWLEPTPDGCPGNAMGEWYDRKSPCPESTDPGN